MIFTIKVCGITDARGLDAAVEAGADAVGFNFYRQSPRFIAPADAALLVVRLPSGVLPVGIFVNEDLSQVEAWMDQSGVAWAQFHGDESAELLSGFSRPWYPALRPRPGEEPEVATWLSPCILLDARRPGHYGGTGSTADWDLARRLARQRPLILAGGLNPQNVERAVENVQPAAVDLNSGVESVPGRKDSVLLRRACSGLENWRRNLRRGTREGA